MYKLKIDRKKIFNDLSKIRKWSDWYKLEEGVFKLDSWPARDIDDIECQLERGDVVWQGDIWKTSANNYDVEPNLLHLHKLARAMVFSSLEPEAHRDNLKNGHEYAKECVYCERWSETSESKICPNCGKELISIKLPD